MSFKMPRIALLCCNVWVKQMESTGLTIVSKLRLVQPIACTYWVQKVRGELAGEVSSDLFVVGGSISIGADVEVLG